MKRMITAVALLMAATASHGAELASRYLCDDGSIISINTTGAHAQVERGGVIYLVESMTPGTAFVTITAGIKNTRTIILDPPDLDNDASLPRFFATYIDNPSDNTTTIECAPDLASRRINW